MRTRATAALRIFWPVEPPDRPPAPVGPSGSVPRPPADGGHPHVVARINGWPVELRIWPSWPGASVEATRHPSGAWFALKVV